MVVAAYVASYGNREPYLTVDEYLNAPTAMDTTNLVENGTPDQQEAALADLIARASSWVDTYCMGAEGTLCATVNTETGRLIGSRRGWTVHPRYWPILEVQAFSVGGSPADLNAQQLTTASCWIEQQQFIVSGAGGFSSSVGPLEFGNVGRVGSEGYAQWTYVSGWPNTTLTAAVAEGGTVITVSSPVGMYPGSQLTIFDGDADEPVQVASVTGQEVTLVTGVQNAHQPGVSVSALPPAVKQATIFMTSALIQSRGDAGIVLDEMSEPKSKQSASDMGDDNISIASELLSPFRTVWGQA